MPSASAVQWCSCSQRGGTGHTRYCSHVSYKLLYLQRTNHLISAARTRRVSYSRRHVSFHESTFLSVFGFATATTFAWQTTSVLVSHANVFRLYSIQHRLPHVLVNHFNKCTPKVYRRKLLGVGEMAPVTGT